MKRGLIAREGSKNKRHAPLLPPQGGRGRVDRCSLRQRGLVLRHDYAVGRSDCAGLIVGRARARGHVTCTRVATARRGAFPGGQPARLRVLRGYGTVSPDTARLVSYLVAGHLHRVPMIKLAFSSFRQKVLLFLKTIGHQGGDFSFRRHLNSPASAAVPTTAWSEAGSGCTICQIDTLDMRNLCDRYP